MSESQSPNHKNDKPINRRIIINPDGTFSGLAIEFDKPNEHGEIFTRATIIQHPVKTYRLAHKDE